MEPNEVLSMKGIVKTFPGVKALTDVDFTLRKGEIHALMGENGAGKSTLIKVLTGVYDKDDGEIKIVRTKKFGFKPMYPEDACVQMELLGHDFYVFCNAESDEVNVVYRRKNGTFGLIEPEFS